MGRTYVTGDLHGEIGINKIVQFNKDIKDLDKSDIIIIAGDFGLVWNNSKQEQYWQNWIDKIFMATVVFVDGNHENFDLLYSLPIINKFEGSVHKINNSIFHLQRGHIYRINGHSFFTFGGASSIDKNIRTSGISWWAQELPTVLETDRGLTSLDSVNNKVDYVITHDAPFEIRSKYNIEEPVSIRPYLKHIKDNLEYVHWYFGHHHINQYYEQHNATCLYEKIIEIV